MTAMMMGAMKVTAGTMVEIGIRPDDLSLTADDVGLDVTVRVVERLGADTIVYGNLPDKTPICAALDGLARITAGDQVKLAVDPAAVHAFDHQGRALPRLAAPEL